MRPNLPLDDLVAAMQDAFRRGLDFSFPPSGVSMLPTICAGRDRVRLRAVRRPLRRGDVALIRRSEGSYVLHRVLARRADGYILCGDNQVLPERTTRADQVLAIMVSLERNGKVIAVTSPRYRLYSAFLMAMRRPRRLWRGLRRRLMR